MKIQNCKIVKAMPILWASDWTTTLQLKLRNAEKKYEKNFLTECGGKNGYNYPPEAKKIIQFAGASNSSELEGKVIREVRNSEDVVVGFGDPIEDEFFWKLNQRKLTQKRN